MKKTIAALLSLVFLLLLLPACGSADQSGEWGAYYKAYRAFTKDFPESTRYICFDNSGVEEENRGKLYDLFYEFCEDEGMILVEGDWSVLYEKGLVDRFGIFTDGYLVSFSGAQWSKDKTELSVSVSLRCGTSFSDQNLGGTVTVTKSDKGWKAVRADDSKVLAGKAGAYYGVFSYFVENAGMSGLKTVLALDPYGVEEDVVSDLEGLLSSYAARQDFDFMKATWDGLVEKGYVNEAGDFTEGYLLSFDNVRFFDNDKTAEITAWMKQGSLDALGGIFTLEYKNGAWQITDAQTMVS